MLILARGREIHLWQGGRGPLLKAGSFPSTAPLVFSLSVPRSLPVHYVFGALFGKRWKADCDEYRVRFGLVLGSAALRGSHRGEAVLCDVAYSAQLSVCSFPC